jgi:hypothetical protein
MAVRVSPRLEVIADETTVHAVALGRNCEVEQPPRSELFGRCLVTES